MVRSALAALAVAVAGSLALAGAGRPAAQGFELAGALDGLARRTQEYYDRFISIICTEIVRQQDLRYNLSPTGRPRLTQYELSVTRDSVGRGEEEFRVGRVLQMVNGRPARKNQAAECTDPKTGSPEPLAFLLAANQAAYSFRPAADADGGPAGAQVLEYAESPPKRVRITWKGNCFEATGGGQEGRIWFDPITFDVLQIEATLPRPISVPMPSAHFGFHPSVRVERFESTLRFSRIEFQDPDELVLLPESIETLTVFRGVVSRRTTQTLTNYRRFLAESTIR